MLNPQLLEEAESAFVETHNRAYWSDANERPPRGHNREFEDCRDPECVRRRALLFEAKHEDHDVETCAECRVAAGLAEDQD